MTFLHSMARFLLALLAFAWVPVSAADWATFATMPPSAKATRPEAFRMEPGTRHSVRLPLGEADAAGIEAVRQANSSPASKRLQIGVGRQVGGKPEALSASLQWVQIPEGMAAQWEVSSAGARALRIGLDAARLSPSTEIRFAGNGGAGTVYGPFTTAEIPVNQSTYWSPVLEGDSAVVEVFVPAGGSQADVSLAITRVSHLFASPIDRNIDALAKASGACEVDIICRTPSDSALAATAKSVAKMSFTGDDGGSYVCTGTLLNSAGGAFTPYFYTANHCFSTQAAASSLTTHWFYDRSSCGSGATGSSYVQLTGGAALLYANSTTDVMLLRLNQNPPSGAIFSGWDAATVSTGVALTAVHHPQGDWKKVSLGSMGGFSAYGGGSGDTHLIALWTSTATGVTEGGSSGSGIFTAVGSPASEYRLRGGLHGGPSSCSATGADLRDYYSRFDRAYSFLSQYLNPGTTCSYTLSPTSQSVGAAASSGSFGVTTASGCTWSATSNASWITTSSSGSGSGTVNYSVSANTGAARSGTISVGGQTFTISQSAGSGGTTSSLISNGGFESGTSGWVQQATSGQPIITTSPSIAHGGSVVAWLGGYVSGTDIIYQDVTIPAGATQVRFGYWYLISTQEPAGPTAYDIMTVTIQNPSTGATLATVAGYSNVNAASGWVQSPSYDLSAFAGQTIRLRFAATNDFSNYSSFFIDDITLTAVTSGGTTGNNYTALWWNPSENGWGINFNHQGNILFGTLYTYDSSGQPLWLVMSEGRLQSDGSTFTGTLYRTTGPPFNSVPFTPIGPGNLSTVGTMSVTFSGANAGTLTYSFNGVTVTKSITKNVYGSRAANCTTTTGSRASLTNYQDLWWNANENGWGVNITHQDSTLFATLYTYDSTGRDLWLVMSGGVRQSDGSYFGDLYRTTGPAFNSVPFTPIGAGNLILVGSMRFTFSSGTSGVMSYSVSGVNVTKSITRTEFSSPLPSCS